MNTLNNDLNAYILTFINLSFKLNKKEDIIDQLIQADKTRNGFISLLKLYRKYKKFKIPLLFWFQSYPRLYVPKHIKKFGQYS
jgi:hypothetical protein